MGYNKFPSSLPLSHDRGRIFQFPFYGALASDEYGDGVTGTLSVTTGGDSLFEDFRALDFGNTGTTGYCEIFANTTAFDAAAFTVAAWFNLRTLTTGSTFTSLFSREISGTNSGFSLLVGQTSTKLEGWTGNGAAFAGLTGSTTIVANTWYHAAMTYDGTTKSIFINGLSDATPAVTGYSAATGTKLAVSAISVLLNSRCVRGFMAAPGMWNRALGADEIYALYAEPLMRTKSIRATLFEPDWPPAGATGTPVSVQSTLRF